MSHTPHSHTYRKRVARIYLAGIFLLIAAADFLFGWFAFEPRSPWLLGVIFGQSISSILLVIGVWRRQTWARYVLIGLIFATITIFSLAALMLSTEPQIPMRPALQFLIPGIASLIAANVWLISSKRIQYLATPAASGG